MDKPSQQNRFSFLAEAFDGVGGFAPRVLWEHQLVYTTDQQGHQISTTRRVPKLSAPCHLVPYPRESVEKFAARAAVGTYENHLREACERFIGFLGRRHPLRNGTDSPLVGLLLDNADMRGTPLSQFLVAFALQAKARGSMLLLIDMPGEPDGDSPASLMEQMERRAVPYLRMMSPEFCVDYDIDDETGLFTSITFRVVEEVDGKDQDCERTWTETGWALRLGDRTVAQGSHPFGQCPVLAFTESGEPYPCIGKYAQIADLSKRIYNAASELDEILRSQTFSLLTLQITPEQRALFDPQTTAATIGTHSMLIHEGATPAFISPDAGPAQTYITRIEGLQQSIDRISMAGSTDRGTQRGVESGVARRIRFEQLNADLASFAHKIQALEQSMWALFHRALGTVNRVVVEWPSDFNLVDTSAELDILQLLQATGFPPAVLSAKMKQIVNSEFDALDDTERAPLLSAIDEIDLSTQSPAALQAAADELKLQKSLTPPPAGA